ncbi:hypothetical protein HELRODRAFT_165337 [Helobdella robusta]|uniref:Uncharacterized protein n=1 Tax=Helobdella robusta TaxID=6412 RepID=T1EWM0_HELRO|nr:hypothetical protein HELRODRAFT_165337 [Helobdella robusta]ESN91324.1 hypothetical protein HELRODRAFT_165337 [Helobdella robusta]
MSKSKKLKDASCQLSLDEILSSPKRSDIAQIRLNLELQQDTTRNENVGVLTPTRLRILVLSPASIKSSNNNNPDTDRNGLIRGPIGFQTKSEPIRLCNRVPPEVKVLQFSVCAKFFYSAVSWAKSKRNQEVHQIRHENKENVVPRDSPARKKVRSTRVAKMLTLGSKPQQKHPPSYEEFVSREFNNMLNSFNKTSRPSNRSTVPTIQPTSCRNDGDIVSPTSQNISRNTVRNCLDHKFSSNLNGQTSSEMFSQSLPPFPVNYTSSNLQSTFLANNIFINTNDGLGQQGEARTDVNFMANSIVNKIVDNIDDTVMICDINLNDMHTNLPMWDEKNLMICDFTNKDFMICGIDNDLFIYDNISRCLVPPPPPLPDHNSLLYGSVSHPMLCDPNSCPLLLRPASNMCPCMNHISHHPTGTGMINLQHLHHYYHQNQLHQQPLNFQNFDTTYHNAATLFPPNSSRQSLDSHSSLHPPALQDLLNHHMDHNRVGLRRYLSLPASTIPQLSSTNVSNHCRAFDVQSISPLPHDNNLLPQSDARYDLQVPLQQATNSQPHEPELYDAPSLLAVIFSLSLLHFCMTSMFVNIHVTYNIRHPRLTPLL